MSESEFELVTVELTVFAGKADRVMARLNNDRDVFTAIRLDES